MSVPSNTRIVELESLDDTFDFADQFAQEILTQANPITFILFRGGLGAGKTTFTRQFGKALGVKEKITSPTFIGLNEYHTEKLSFFHLDMYQVKQSYDSFKELIDDECQNVFVIEWSENMPENLLETLKQNPGFQIYLLDIEIADSEKRTLSVAQA